MSGIVRQVLEIRGFHNLVILENITFPCDKIIPLSHSSRETGDIPLNVHVSECWKPSEQR
jgi:hypothetical protein